MRVAFAFLVEQLRRIPGARHVQRHAGLIATVLLIAAAVVLGVWMAQRSPQRVSLADLREGNLSPLQRWIIVEGELVAQGKPAGDFQYALTDPNVPQTLLIVFSHTELPVGHETVSGTLIGGTRRAAQGFGWTGQLRADPELAREPDTPWLAIGLALAGLFVIAASRTRYPVFFNQDVTSVPARPVALPVRVRSDQAPRFIDTVPGTLTLTPGSETLLDVDGRQVPLRLHSAQSSLEAGVLRQVSISEPALVLHLTTDDFTLTFDSPAERDEAVAALAAHLHPRGRRG